MKTTIHLKDDVARRLKSRAALRGQSLSNYLEESLEKRLEEDESTGDSVADWIQTLPKVSRSVAKELDDACADAPFSKVDMKLFQ